MSRHSADDYHLKITANFECRDGIKNKERQDRDRVYACLTNMLTLPTPGHNPYSVVLLVTLKLSLDSIMVFWLLSRMTRNVSEVNFLSHEYVEVRSLPQIENIHCGLVLAFFSFF